MFRAGTLAFAIAVPLTAAAQTRQTSNSASEQHRPTHHHHHHHVVAHARTHPPVHHATAAIAPPPPPPAKPSPPPPPPVGTVTGLPLPRFASFRSEEVNMRSGPGTRYPIQWVYKRRDLPVEIEREFDVWRLVQTDDGTQGWVHQATLIGNRTFVVLPALPAAGAGELATAQTLRQTAADNALPAATLKPGVIGRVVSCAAGSEWCQVEVHNVTGFLPRRTMWGLLPNEAVSPR